MDINYILKGVFITVCSLLSYVVFSQSNSVSKEMTRYSVKNKFKPEIDKVIKQLKPIDQKLIFTVNTSIENNIYQISLTTDYDVEMDDSWIGFCEYQGKLFLLKSKASETFFTKEGQDIIQLNMRMSQKSNDIVQPYLDNLPYWLFEYQNESFKTKFSFY